MTSHSFFNLGDDPTATIVDPIVRLNADQVLENDDRLLPTGVLRDVTDTLMDLRKPKPFGQDFLEVVCGTEAHACVSGTEEGFFSHVPEA